MPGHLDDNFAAQLRAQFSITQFKGLLLVAEFDTWNREIRDKKTGISDRIFHRQISRQVRSRDRERESLSLKVLARINVYTFYTWLYTRVLLASPSFRLSRHCWRISKLLLELIDVPGWLFLRLEGNTLGMCMRFAVGATGCEPSAPSSLSIVLRSAFPFAPAVNLHCDRQIGKQAGKVHCKNF